MTTTQDQYAKAQALVARLKAQDLDVDGCTFGAGRLTVAIEDITWHYVWSPELGDWDLLKAVPA